MTENEIRFRGIRALYGEDGFLKLQNATVMVVGVGGVGSWLTEALCRSGVGSLILVDPDLIEMGNSNRQLHTTTKTYGINKAQALKERLLDINPLVKVQVIETYLTPDNIDETFANICPNYVAEAIDDIKAKAYLVNYLYKKNITFITSGGAGGRVDPTRLTLCDISKSKGDALIQKLRFELRRHYNFPKGGKKMGIMCSCSDEIPTYSDESLREERDLPVWGASMAVTASAGLLLASYILNKITNKK